MCYATMCSIYCNAAALSMPCMPYVCSLVYVCGSVSRSVLQTNGWESALAALLCRVFFRASQHTQHLCGHCVRMLNNCKTQASKRKTHTYTQTQTQTKHMYASLLHVSGFPFILARFHFTFVLTPG